MSLFDKKIDGVPQFVSYFPVVHRVMQALGGRAKARQVYDYVAAHEGLTPEQMAQVNSNGKPTFENRTAWARFYMTKAGWMYSPKYGEWALTDEGKAVDVLTDEMAAALFKRAQNHFKGNEDQADAPEDKVQPDGTQYWFVGALWGNDDQSTRFVQEGIWQNGYEEKFADSVHAMKPGDRIAIKSSFARKHHLPFDNKHLSISGMKIKAVGTITRNHGDGRTVDVEWEPVGQVREWYFYTYRSTVTRARVEDEAQARRLVAFAFDGAPQDYDFFLGQPYWRNRFEAAATASDESQDDEQDEEALDEVDQPLLAASYGVAQIVAEGCFVPAAQLQAMLQRWQGKKNLILQGPPGTGKTWLAKRLASALTGQKNVPDEQLRVVQFHPALSYEDFVRGYRPGSDGRLGLADGVFLQVVQSAIAQPDVVHVLIIEEINRGNPAQVLGEMLTLLEGSKRARAEAMELAYPRHQGEKVYVPDNLYVIGTMNVADRSLALVDLALRRRFAFVNLEPMLGDAWAQWCTAKGLGMDAIARIRSRMSALNDDIAQDRALGKQFQIGHSYVTPHEPVHDAGAWFEDVVRSEIGPLLHEYWFDAPERAEAAITKLLQTA